MGAWLKICFLAFWLLSSVFYKQAEVCILVQGSYYVLNWRSTLQSLNWIPSISIQLLVNYFFFFLPNWSILIDFCHHFFPSTDRTIVSNFPESVVLYHMAFSKSDTSSTLVELLAFYGEKDYHHKIMLFFLWINNTLIFFYFNLIWGRY